MATIKELMPYLEQGYNAFDHVRNAYLYPQNQDGTLVFVWTAYEGESEWSGPQTHSLEYVLTWRSSNWGVECHTEPTVPHGGRSYYAEDKPEKIEEAIARGLACKPQSSMGTFVQTLDSIARKSQETE